MKKLWLLISLCAGLMAVKCPQQQPSTEAAEIQDATVETGPATTSAVTDTLAADQAISPGDSLANGGIISPNKAPDQARIDSIKREQMKRKKKSDGGGEGDHN
ncbi:MAG: hypothetical protein R2830_23350 [Saprospiraceae bacterium]